MGKLLLDGPASADEVRMSGNDLVFSSFISATNDEYIFLNQNLEYVIVRGANFTLSGLNRLSNGTITEIIVYDAASPLSPVKFRIEEISIPGFYLGGSAGDEMWDLVMRDVDFIKTNDGRPLFGGGDGFDHFSGTFYGSDTTVRGIYGDNSSWSGAFSQTSSSAITYGGDMQFAGGIRTIVGDVSVMQSSAILIGGDDRIRMVDVSQNDIGGISDMLGSGDVNLAFDQTEIYGGDDYLDYRDVESFAFGIRLVGDVNSATGGLVRIVGGDDIINGSRTKDNVISGDLGSGTFARLVGGDDTIFGFSGDDRLYGDLISNGSEGIGGDDKIYGGGGDDTIAGNGGDDFLVQTGGTVVAYGGLGNDQFRPNEDGAHTFYGGAGVDTINYSRSDERLRVDLFDSSNNTGWAEDDVLAVENVVGTDKTDFIYGDAGANRILSGDNPDLVDGRGGGDIIASGAGNDRINAGFGVNSYYGGTGNDLLSYETSTDGVYVKLDTNFAARGNASGDTISSIENLFGSDGGDDLIGGNERQNELRGFDGNDRLFSKGGADAIFGMADDDRLFGGSGFDRVYGGSGEDYIEGGKDDDFLWGNSNADTFHFNRGDARDTIRDFQNNVDTIEIDGYSSSFDPFARAFDQDGDAYLRLYGGDWIIVLNTTVAELRNDVELV